MDFKFKKSNLNFRVYTSETEPTTPGIENDIVIITSVPMTNWILSPDKPEGMPRTDGDVWIRYSAKGGTFNALKNESMWIATISAYQFIDGSWVDVTAKRYQGDKWVDWIPFLYDRGKIGLGGAPTQIYKDGTKTDVVVTLNTDYISINLSGNVSNRAGFPDAVDFSPYSTMKVTVKAPSKWSNSVQFRFGVDSTQLTSAAYEAQTLNGYTANTEYTITLDISSYNKTSKPWFELYNGTGQGEENSLYVLEIGLE